MDTEHEAPDGISEKPLCLVTADSHVGPRLREDLRPYCERKHLRSFDDWVEQVQGIADGRYDNVGSHYDNLDPLFKACMDWNAQTAGHHDVGARLRDMDADGVAAEVIFHGSQNLQPMPFDAQNFFGNDIGGSADLSMAAVGKRIYNRWLSDFCSVEPARHVGLAQVPMWDIEASIDEVERAAAAGLRGVNFPAADAPGMASLDDPRFEEFYSVCADLRMPLTTHLSPSIPNHRYVDSPAYGPEIATLDAGWWSRRAMLILTCTGAFERHPGLRLVITEVPGVWYREAVEDIDSLYYGHANGKLREFLPRAPAEYIRENVWVGSSFPSAREAADAVEGGVADRMMWGSDYPHVEGTWSFPEKGTLPMTHLALASTYSGLPIVQVRGMVGMNAIACYDRLDPRQLVAVAAEIGAPTPLGLFENAPSATRPPHNRVASSAFRTRAAWQ